MELKQGKPGASCKLNSLLIVPYGIETLQLRASYLGGQLLIVPYGIETATHAAELRAVIVS